jgi:membrane protease YdiL (CAAX protease family)
MRAVIRRYPLTAFVVLACLFGWSIWIGIFLAGGHGGGNLPLAPLMAVLVVAPCQGRDAFLEWWGRLRNWRAAPRLYLLALLGPIALHVLIVLVNGGLGAPLPTSSQLTDSWQVPGMFVVLLVLIGIGEEAGWTAFMAPVLLRRHGVLVAWGIASSVRIAWHIPVMISGELPLFLGIVGNAAFTMVLMALLVVRGGNWSLAAVWHAMVNAAGYSFLFTMVSGEDHSRLSVLMAVEYTFVGMFAYGVVRRNHASLTGVDRRPTTGGTHVDRHA